MTGHEHAQPTVLPGLVQAFAAEPDEALIKRICAGETACFEVLLRRHNERIYRTVRAILVLTHDGPYSRGEHGGNAIARDRYVPILARYHVDFLFSGHDHIYQRGEQAGLKYAVSGGGGASLYDIRCGTPRRKCKVEDGMLAVAKEHHYIVLAIGKRDLEFCARKEDGKLIEKCAKLPLWVR